ncbi:hypothetical protein NFI96_014689 [Prochilodus magdalenae]|nr:hypothetical protein NFI96_014689 [Prochilodus magdalenae]
MGNIIAYIFSRQTGRSQVKLLMVGLDAAGKTTVLYKLKLGEVVTTIPTIGFNVETVEYKNISFCVWDVGGQDVIRRLWRHYYQNTSGLIFVVDSNDCERVEAASAELLKMVDTNPVDFICKLCLSSFSQSRSLIYILLQLQEDELRDAVVLVLANKQDLPNAMPVHELTEKLGLHTLKGRNLVWMQQERPQSSTNSNWGKLSNPDESVSTSFIYTGFNLETVEYKNISFTVWDVGGPNLFTGLWRHYYCNTSGLIVVVDSNDSERIEQMTEYLQKMLQEDELRDTVMLVLANKQDLPEAMPVQEVTEKLGLHTLKGRNWHIQPTCAVNGSGLYEGMDWLANQLTKN